ncbi:MAG: ATP-binding cassette domain-containing protein [Victivallales bacterium]|nr:ATP-binding cassette domain-containing protein [Victivallales bacterium]
MPQVILTVNQLHVQIADHVLVDNQDFLLHEGERVGLIGRNGSGKSTLMKILAGQEQFFTGEVTLTRGIRAAYLPQEVDLTHGKTVRENILEGAQDILRLMNLYEHPTPGTDIHDLERKITARDGWNLESRIDMLLSSLAAPDANRLIDNLSGGEKRRVGLCRALLDYPDLLLLDEPTNHLDAETIAWLENYILKSKGTVLYVTHDRAFLDHTSTKIIELFHGLLYHYDGNYSDFLLKKAERENEAEIMEAKRLAFIRREIEWIRRAPCARGTKQNARIQRFEAAYNQEALKRDQDVNLILPPPPKTGNIILELQDASLSLGGKQLFSHLSFSFETGMKLGVVGRNGLGKTSLLRMMIGQLQPTDGNVRIGERTIFNYTDQHRVTLHNDKTVYEEIGEGNDFVLFDGRKLNIWSYLKGYLFQDDEINTQVGQLSGGERNRLVLAKKLKEGGNFLLLDEPTNDLDLPTLRVLEEAIIDFAGCVVIVSHDRYFLDRVCTHILAFEGDGKTFIQPGGWTYYEQKRLERENAARSAQVAAQREKTAAEPVRKPTVRKLKYMEQKELESIEDTIAAAEEKVSELEALFSQPDFHVKYGKQTTELTQKLNDARAEVERLYARWDELEKIKNGLA